MNKMLVLILVVFLSGCDTPSFAYTDEEAINTIIGEAANQGLIGMIAVGEVIRNRKSLKGFYGHNAKHIKSEPPWVRQLAGKAWVLSKSREYTHGATFFENIKAFGVPYWAKNCVVTFKYKDHVFMKRS